MVGLDHGSSQPAEAEDATISARNARYGMVLFLIYLALYSLFVVLNAFQPAIMERRPWLGINLAIWYGMGLIAAALLLALIYSWLCRRTTAGSA